MLFLQRSPRWAYATAVLASGFVLALDAASSGALRIFLGTVGFVFAVLAAAALGGWKPGLSATVTILAGYVFFFIEPRYTFRIAHASDLLVLSGYGVTGAAISFLCEALHFAGARLADRQRTLENEIVEHRQDELALRRAEAHATSEAQRNKQTATLLRVTLASIGDGVVATDADGRLTFMNTVAESLTGWNETEARGRPLVDVFRIVNERTRAPVDNPWEKVLATGTIVELANHTILISKDGRERPIDDSAAPICDESGKVLGVVLIFRDATKERAALENLQRLAAIVEHSDDAIIGKTLEGTITNWNAAAERLYGFTAQEAIGQPISIIVPSERKAELAGIIAGLKQGQPIKQLETVRQRKDGSRVDVSLTVSPIRDADGEVVGASKLARDITDRKRAEKNLKFLVEASDAVSALVDMQSSMQKLARHSVPLFADWCSIHLVTDSGSIEKLAQAHADKDKDVLLHEFFNRHPVDWSRPSPQIRVLRSGRSELAEEVKPVQFASMIEDDRHRELLEALDPRSFIVVPVQSRGHVAGTIEFVRSESRPPFSGEDLQLAQDLAQRVATAIENCRLYEELRLADRQKDDFLAMLAHELRNPLAAISYAGQLLTLSPEDGDSAAAIVSRQVQQLSNLINDLLDVSRITRGMIQLKKESLDAEVLVHRAIGTSRPLLEQQNHTVETDLATMKMPLFVDPTRVEQVLVNLITNAAKYTPKGGHVTIRAFPQDDQVVICVKDSGIGIPPTMLPRVFELFTQVNPSIDRTQGGLGIGLTVVRRLVEMHEGTVSASSEGLGKGSEFTIRLPMGRVLQAGDATPPLPTSVSAGLRVLVVDDNVDTAQSVSLLLKTVACITETAYDGQSAIERAKSFRPDVIVLDIGLPGLDGYEVATRIRRDPAIKHAKLIAISGYGQEQDRTRAKQAGFDHHLVKPVQFDALCALVSKAT